MTRLGFAGDVMLGRLIDERQRERSVSGIWGNMEDTLRELDGFFINLECCLSARGTPWTDTYRPFHFRADPDWAVPALESVGVDWVNLANNHILDYGPDALADTIGYLDDAGIAHSGAGETLEAACAPAFATVDGLDIAFVSFTDNTSEFAAGPDEPGTAYVDFDVTHPQAVRLVGNSLGRARDADPDLLVVSLHWGPNMRTEPTVEFREFARWLAEEGVDVVHGHSAHVFQGVEVVDETLVCYDTGDFVDDYATDSEQHNDRSFLFEVGVADSELSDLRLRPTEIYDLAVHEAEHYAGTWSVQQMDALSSAFGTEFQREDDDLLLPL
ncbi:MULTISPECIES: CapA family protein [unclassified Haladaptatus]|uniref:CapA family protein n=1 Tax=unclassified Haladaptatus TaxID=2622732 RepID=UPI00209C0553|nr:MULTISPECIES: CapA family protein [unclassified Haladaptatus]MCO8242847.1 CapA family protein [Haladaptatus sp. AB643]MCO8252607.1 CapA family protein [Haladaptatus sp. AB618]